MERELEPPVLVGEKVFWLRNFHNKPVCGTVKWIGNIPEINSGWSVGIEVDTPLPHLECNGFWKNRKLFECRSKHGLIAPLNEIQKINSKNKFVSTAENNLRLHLDDTQTGVFAHPYLRRKFIKKETHRKNHRSNLEESSIHESFKNRTPKPEEVKKVDQRKTTKLLSDSLQNQKSSRRKSEDIRALLKNEKTQKKNLEKTERNFENDLRLLNSFTDFNENLKDVQRLDLKTFIREPVINMNEVAGYFKEIKEEDERTETQNKMDDLALYGMVDATEPGQSKPKKLFSFLKWFNKKQKHDPNLKLFKEASAASSPIFPRKETSSCESIDTIFSTQTVRSFAYIPPTQYVPSAPPLEYDKSSYENLCENDSSQKSKSEETESIYERRKKRRAPEPPRLSRENSLPTTLERKTNEDEDFDGIKTYHRRTVSESFKDKKAGAYCHVQGKRKAPLPPGSALYPNLQKLDNQYPSLYKKKKPAPPPPELNLKNRNSGEAHQSRKDGQNEDEKNSPNEKIQKEKLKDSKDNRIPGKEEKGVKISQSSKVSLTKDSSLSPLPSRPWYKRNHRDSTGSNIIRKDLLKGFDKKKKESDDWMPEVGFSRRSLSSESGHNKFNIFSRLEKTEDKKKEEKRKSQISILTNISELDREAAEIVRKEQAEEKKMMAANDDKYYSSKGKEKDLNFSEPLRDEKKHCNANNKNISLIHKEVNDEQQGKRNVQSNDKILQTRISTDEINTKEVKGDKNHKVKDEQSNAREDKIKGKENHSVADKKSKENVKQKPPSTSTLAGLINPSTEASAKEKDDNSSQTPSQSRLNHFNVENKKLSYLNEPWVCKKCTLENPGWRVFCEICNSVKPRFLFNQAASNIDASKEKHHQNNSQKPEMVTEKPDMLKELNLEEKNQNQATNTVVGTTSRPQDAEDEKENTKSEVILDDLRKKRMTFFTSKLETLPETNKNDAALNNTNDVMNLLPKDKQEKEKLTKSGAENFINTDMKNPKKEKIKWPESPEEPTVPQEKPKTIAVPTEQNANDDLNSGALENPTTPGNSQVIEAYVVTKTVVLEDIIVKKPERGRKVSTKSKRSTSPEAKVISPPPRAKKIVFDVTPEAKAETEIPSNSGNGFQKIAENHRQEEIEKLTSRLTQAEGLADFRANIETMAPNTEMNTVAVNRLLRKLETAINCGDHFLAGSLAKELALMKINCSVTRQVTPTPSTSNVVLDLYIEDKVSHQGPIPIEVSPSISVLQLKNKVKQELGIPLEVQRWILGKKLATDDSKTLEAEGVKSNYSPVFLYLVAPDNRKTNKAASTKSEKSTSSEKPHQNSDESPPGAKRKGLYYNYEEDRESYCEDSEEEKKASSPDCTNKTKGISPPAENKFFNNDKKSAAAEIGIGMKENPPSVFDLKSRDTENDLEKELKLISVNSVKQKVEKINKSFVENAKAVKPLFRHSRSPETWKCGACHFVNSPGKLNCSSCNVKKVFSGPYSRKPEDGNQLIKEGLPKKENQNPTNGVNIHYKALIELQDADLVPNTDPFNCSICLMDYTSGEGVTLKDCLHTFCRTCLISTVQFSEDAEVKCPYLDETYSCPSVLQQREIKALVPRGIFELHLAKSVKEAENKINNAFHCKTPDCKGWCIYEDNVNEFHCPVCKSTNCLTCQAVHSGINCREFQERMKVASETDVDAKKTTDMLNEMVEKGEAMACPKCQVVLMKKWGCDWLKCSMCKTEICWVTRGFRWGPEGKGDTSGGCKCGVNGIKCHPKCNYCH